MIGLAGVCLFHTFLGAEPEDTITCSDASTTGGAIAYADELSRDGQVFVCNQKAERRPIPVPIAVLTLFNGVGAAVRCYDLAGAEIRGGLAAEIHAPAQRTMSRRWPHIQHWEDIRTLTKNVLEDCLEKIGGFEEIHLWAGFPCIDLSSAKHGRKNLDGPGSGLIHEALRVRSEVKETYPMKKLISIIENVSSMDTSARDELTELP